MNFRLVCAQPVLGFLIATQLSFGHYELTIHKQIAQASAAGNEQIVWAIRFLLSVGKRRRRQRKNGYVGAFARLQAADQVVHL
jgi:hypothetical protein